MALAVSQMAKYHWGKKRFDFKGGLPRLYLHEKQEKVVRWSLRILTGVGIILSVFSLPWYFSLSFSLGLVVLAWFIERTLFYYTSMYVSPLMLDYDPDKWVGMVAVSIGEPTDPESKKIVGIWLQDEDYARRFFEHLHNVTGRVDGQQGDLRLTFIVDEDMYYVFLYSDLQRKAFTSFAERVKSENLLTKYGKEHFPLIMSQIICHGFETTKGFALGMFLDTHPTDEEFLLAPYVGSINFPPRPAASAEPIKMTSYKFKLPHELTQDDFEYLHWHKVVKRTAAGADA